jgi:hypothetical protein
MGQVAGVAEFSTLRFHAFITGPDGAGITDLGSVEDLPAYFGFASAIDINNHGQLAAVGAVLIPEPEIYAMLLLGLGLIGFLARGRATA